MVYQASVFRVFIASPSDVQEERQAVQEVLARWNCLHSTAMEIVLLPVRWESHAYPASGNAPQTILNEQILVDADLLIGVFWTRLGTPTDEYPSGTVEEYERHIESGKPAMLYFSQEAIPSDHDREQLCRLHEFKKKLTDEKKCLYSEYASRHNFRDKLLDSIIHCVIKDTYFHDAKKVKPTKQSQPSNVELSDLAKNMLIVAIDTNSNIADRRNSGGFIIGPYGEPTSKIELGNNREVTSRKAAISELEKKGFVRATDDKREVFVIIHDGYEWKNSHKCDAQTYHALDV